MTYAMNHSYITLRLLLFFSPSEGENEIKTIESVRVRHYSKHIDYIYRRVRVLPDLTLSLGF